MSNTIELDRYAVNVSNMLSKLQIGCRKCDQEVNRKYCQECGSCETCGVYHGKLDTRCEWCNNHKIMSKEELTTHHCIVCDEEDYETEQYGQSNLHESETEFEYCDDDQDDYSDY